MRKAISWPPVIRGLGARTALFELALQCEFKVARLAARLGVSQWWLQRFFQLKLQASPGAWLREQRLQLARQMLCEARTVKQVAYALQFRSPSQFCRDFKARFGLSPSAALHGARSKESAAGASSAASPQPAWRVADAD